MSVYLHVRERNSSLWRQEKCARVLPNLSWQGERLYTAHRLVKDNNLNSKFCIVLIIKY